MFQLSDEPDTVLVVEDDPAHAALIEAAFHYRSISWHVHVTMSSEEATAYLRGFRPFHARRRYPLPDVIILDLGLQGVGGLDFLRWMDGRDEPWSEVPIIIFTAARQPTIAAQAVALGAREVLVKPADFTELVQTVTDLLQRWRPRRASQSRRGRACRAAPFS